MNNLVKAKLWFVFLLFLGSVAYVFLDKGPTQLILLCYSVAKAQNTLRNIFKMQLHIRLYGGKP